MEKIKSLLPSLREKTRYIKYDVITDSEISHKDVQDEIHKTLLSFLGQLGTAKAGVIMLNNNIIRVNAKYINEVISALTLVKKCKNKNITIKTDKISGVLNKLKGG